MLSVFVLVLFWSRFAAALQPHGSTAAVKTASAGHHVPCFVDDILAMLDEATGEDGELPNESLTLFGICTASDNSSSRSVLSELSEEMRGNTREGLEVLSPAAVLVSQEDDGETVTVTLDLSQSPLLRLKPVLILVFEGPLTGGDMDVTFSSQSLQPNVQSVCFSEGTRYTLLTGKSSEQRWRISVRPKSPDMSQNLKDTFIGGKSGSDARVTPLLLFSAEKGTDTRHSNSSSSSSQTSFLCELRRFLDAVLPQDRAKPPVFQMDSLQSLPPLPLGLSSSEALLAGIINSSAPTVFSFSSWRSGFLVRREQLALSPALLEELKQRLEKSEVQMTELVRQEKVTHRATKKLEKLKELSASQRNDPAADGESQYRAFLLLKALQTVTHAYDMQWRLRATRADSSSPQRPPTCRLRSLTASFTKLFFSPQSANIYNCQGSCALPLDNINNHATLLIFHVEDGATEERAPCCVPLAYDPLEVIDFNEEGSFLSIKPDMIAKECGCR